MMNTNRGSATLEATLILPLFIFGMLAFYHMGQALLGEQVLYEGACETLEYIAEYSYVSEPVSVLAYGAFPKYIDRQELLEKYIDGGMSGVSLSLSGPDADDYLELKVNYIVQVDIPLLGSISEDRSYTIRQKAYTGYKLRETAEGAGDEEVYVFITDNREAYHTTRSCTHLSLTVHSSTIEGAENNGYEECDFCTFFGDKVYVTDWGNKYHSRRDCIGLKRTVYRVKKSQVPDVAPCNRCGY